MFTDIIELLLPKKASLVEEMEAEKQAACAEIEAKYAERSEKINGLLSLAGYVEPVAEEVVDETEEVTEATEEVVEEPVSEEAAVEENVESVESVESVEKKVDQWQNF